MWPSKPWTHRCVRWIVCACLIGLLCALTACAGTEGTDDTVIFHFIDVGQADASLITTPAGAILIDAGSNASEAELRAYLEVWGVKRLACAIFTHPHEDHVGGADGILSSLAVDQVILPETEEDSVVARRMMEAVAAAGCPVVALTAGQRYVVTLGNVTVTVYAPLGGEPDPETEDAPEIDENDRSLIVRVRYGRRSVLYMGDAGEACENALLAQWADGGELDSDILKVGHHGSASSTTEALLDAVRPTYAVVSVGAGNAYGHPSSEMLTRLSDRRISCLRTDAGGGRTVRLATDGEELWVADEYPYERIRTSA